jgi:vitamin B12 transporter
MEKLTMSFRSNVLAAACALGLPGAAFAQAATDLDEVIVTATRTAITVDDALAAVEVIDSEEIARSQARSLPELLRGRAGVNLVNQGGVGKLTTLFLRGSESDHVLVLVDGVRIGSATSGLAAFQDLPIDQIDRVEVVRGPRSSLYGSDAIGGVIQVFTKRGADGTTARARIGIGSHDAREASAGISVGDARAWFGADAAYQRTDGINACNGFFDPVTFAGAGCFIAPGSQPDRDGYRNRSLTLRGGWKASDALSLEGTALRAEGENDFDGDFINRSETVQQVVGGKLRYDAGERVALQFGVGSNRDASDNFLDGVAMGFFDTRRDSASLQGDIDLADDQLLTLGVDWLRDRVDSNTLYDETRRGNRAAFAQYQGAFGAHDVQASLRRDDNDQFGSETTGGAAWGLAFGRGFRVTAGYGTAFKAPTFNELYFPFFSNPELRPESSDSIELGLRQRGGTWGWRIDAYETDVDDLIAFDASINRPNNVDRARIRGVELGVDTDIAGWTLAAQAGHLDPRNRSAGSDGALLPRRARNTARIDLDRSFGGFRAGLTWIAEGERYDDLANTLRLGGYATLDLRLEYALAKDWTLQARASNVFDRDYETAAFYNQPGREFLVSLRYAPVR